MAKKENQEKKPKAPLNAGDYIARGILIGGALGVFGYLLGFTPNLRYSIGLGMIAGFAAGVTLGLRRGSKNKKE